MRIGICTFCGDFGEVHLHHQSKETIIVVCLRCHFRIHCPLPDMSKKLPPELRFKLDMMAYKYEVETRGLHVSNIVIKLVNLDLSPHDRGILEDVAEFFESSLEKVREAALGCEPKNRHRREVSKILGL